MPEGEKVSRNQFLNDRIDEQSQSFQSSGSQDGGLALLAERHLDGSLPPIDLQKHGRDISFNAAAISERERKPRERRDAQILQNLF